MNEKEKDFLIPEPALEEVRAMINGASDDAVLKYARAHRVVLKGFRLSKESVPTIKKRIAATVRADRELDPSLVVLADDSHLGISLLGTVGESLIDYLFEDLLVLCGESKLLAAMLLDPNPDIRDIAEAYIEDADEAELPGVTPARERVLDALMPFFGLTQGWLQESMKEKEAQGVATEKPPAAAAVKTSPALEARVAELERLLKKSAADATREAGKQRKKLGEANAQNQRLRHELAEATRQLNEEQGKRKDMKATLHKTQADYQALELKSGELVRAGIERELATALNRWTQPLAREEAQAQRVKSDTAGDALMARAEETLREQAARDRHSGNRVVLRERLERLQELLRQVMQTRVEALHPLPALQHVESELRGEINRLAQLVGAAPEDASGFVENMIARINAAQSGDELADLKRIIEQLDAIKVLESPALQRLYTFYNRRMSLLYAAFTPKVVRKKQHSDDPVWRLKHAIDENEDMVIILDGHNLLHLLPNIFGDSYEDGAPLKQSREKLINVLLPIIANAPRCRFEVIFDGPKFTQRSHADNLREVYSGGGTGEHRADKYIIEYLEYCCRQMSAMPRVLVSDDRDLRAKAAEFGAGYIPVPQFGAFLQEMQV